MQRIGELTQLPGLSLQIYQRSGYRAFREAHAARGPAFAAAVEGLSYQLAPRAALFRRDEGDAADVASLQRLMRSNDWAADSVRRQQKMTRVRESTREEFSYHSSVQRAAEPGPARRTTTPNSCE